MRADLDRPGRRLAVRGGHDRPRRRASAATSSATRPSATSISFRETQAGGTYAPHDAPTRQFVITLSGTLEFKTAPGATFVINPGDILLAEDTTGSGHSWRLTDDNPWRRAYVILADGADVPFKKAG